MKALVFFVSLCTLLLIRHNFVYAGTHYGNGLANTEKAHHDTFIAPQQDATLLQYTNTDPDNSTELFVGEDLEDEDGNTLPQKNYRILANCSSSLSYLLNYNPLHNLVKASLPFCSHLSYKNPIQSVLRI